MTFKTGTIVDAISFRQRRLFLKKEWLHLNNNVPLVWIWGCYLPLSGKTDDFYTDLFDPIINPHSIKSEGYQLEYIMYREDWNLYFDGNRTAEQLLNELYKNAA